MLRVGAIALGRGVGAAARAGAGAAACARSGAGAGAGLSGGWVVRAGGALWPPSHWLRAAASGVADGPVEVDPGTLVDERQFETMADGLLEEYGDRIEAYLEETDTPADVELAMGVLTVQVEGRGTFVLNKQTPNRQLWLSSPLSGPWRYDCHPEASLIGQSAWVYRRDGHVLSGRLAREVPEVCGTQDVPLDLDIDA